MNGTRSEGLLFRRHALPVLAAACALAPVSGGGLHFELLRRVEKQLGEQFTYGPKPWRRCLEELRTGLT